jgi:hypothetical protein
LCSARFERRGLLADKNFANTKRGKIILVVFE